MAAFWGVDQPDELFYFADGHDLDDVLGVDDEVLEELFPELVGLRVAKVVVEPIEILASDVDLLLAEHLHFQDLEFVRQDHQIDEGALVELLRGQAEVIVHVLHQEVNGCQLGVIQLHHCLLLWRGTTLTPGVRAARVQFLEFGRVKLE